MQKFIYILAFVCATGSAFSQNVSDLKQSVFKLSKNKQWDVCKYLWSYTQNKTENNKKDIIDFGIIDGWQGLGNYLTVSRNGKYFAYTVASKNVYLDKYEKLDTLVIQSTDLSYRRTFTNVQPGFFTPDNKHYIFKNNENLCFLKLGEKDPFYIEDVSSFKLNENGNNEWLVYKLKNSECDMVLRNLITGSEKRFCGSSDYNFDPKGEWFSYTVDSGSLKELILYNLSTGVQKRFEFVLDHLFARNGDELVLKTVRKSENGTITALELVNLIEGNDKIIWSTQDTTIGIVNYNVDNVGKQIVFCLQSSSINDNKGRVNNIWYYRAGMDQAIQKVTNQTSGIDTGLEISANLVSFTDNGNYIKFSLQPRPSNEKADPEAAQLEVWSYKDLNLQSVQASIANKPKNFKVVIGIEDNQVMSMESNDRSLALLQGDFAVVRKGSKETYGDRFWEAGYNVYKDSNWLVAFKNGSRRLIPAKTQSLWFSPGGNYLVYFDSDKDCHYFSCNLRTGKVTDIASNIPVDLLGYHEMNLRTGKRPEFPIGLAAWVENDAGLLVYDYYDVWLLDLSGEKHAVNVTNNYGSSQGIIFSLMNSKRFLSEIPILKTKDDLLLRAFNTRNKYNGFYYKRSDATGNPKLLSMGQYFMNLIPWCQDPNLSNIGMSPVKAKDSNSWIVQRQSTTDAPNYYETSDFRLFQRLTDFQPHKKINWLSQELHAFKHLDGKIGQGILYKPENFDPSKKYPVLIIFYGMYSNNLYQFRIPNYNITAITPALSPIWFLNQGYLVFTPDIYVAPIKYGAEALNVIEGAVNYLKQLPYVDPNKFGCCSHSWSAKLGAYIFTHSKSITATAISEGYLYGNMINAALSTGENGTSQLGNVENNFHFGDFWKNKNSWLDQTTVINVDKANSPLLLLCNKKSTEDYQNQTLQLFTALRRLDKQVWWLKYANGSHTLDDLSEEKDYTIRYTQFFDHYLKQAPAPKWMTQGLPFTSKGLENRFELDPAGSCGKNCKVCRKWNDQYKKDPAMFTKTIDQWHLDEKK